jgi:hypothetical protein
LIALRGRSLWASQEQSDRNRKQTREFTEWIHVYL